MVMQSGEKEFGRWPGRHRRGNHGILAREPNDINTAAEEFILKYAQGELNSSIEVGELRLRYQPQVNMGNGKITGVEALIHWEHPDFGVVSHSALAALIGGTAMEKVVSEWAVRQVCANLRCMSQHGLPAVQHDYPAFGTSADEPSFGWMRPGIPDGNRHPAGED